MSYQPPQPPQPPQPSQPSESPKEEPSSQPTQPYQQPQPQYPQSQPPYPQSQYQPTQPYQQPQYPQSQTQYQPSPGQYQQQPQYSQYQAQQAAQAAQAAQRPPQTNVAVAKPRGGTPAWLLVVLGLVALCLLVTLGGVGYYAYTAQQALVALQASSTQVAATQVAVQTRAARTAEAVSTQVARQSLQAEATRQAITLEAEETAAAAQTEVAVNIPTVEVDELPTEVPETEPTATTQAEAQPTQPPGQQPTQPPTNGTGIGGSAETAGLRITLNSVRRSEGGRFLKPQAGYEYLILDLTFENIGTKETTVSNFISGEVKDSTGQQYSMTFTEDTKNPRDGTIAPGDKSRGEVAFEVPKDATGLVYIFEPLFGGEAVRFQLDK